MNILWFKDCSYSNKNMIGGKCASLGELYRLSEKLKFNISDGFAITTFFYDNFIKNIKNDIKTQLNKVDINHIDELNNSSEYLKNIIMQTKFSNLEKELFDNFNLLLSMKKSSVAVRSSAVAEDLPNASFAGQQDTYLNIYDFDNFLIAIKKCIASLFNARAISYRKTNNVPLEMVKISIGVQLMVRSDIGVLGLLLVLILKLDMIKLLLLIVILD